MHPPNPTDAFLETPWNTVIYPHIITFQEDLNKTKYEMLL